MEFDTSHDSGTDVIDFYNYPLIIDSSLSAGYTSHRTVYGAAHEISHARLQYKTSPSKNTLNGTSLT